jgi:hypothetical protein
VHIDAALAFLIFTAEDEQLDETVTVMPVSMHDRFGNRID